jgi:hypothetical protein
MVHPASSTAALVSPVVLGQGAFIRLQVRYILYKRTNLYNTQKTRSKFAPVPKTPPATLAAPIPDYADTTTKTVPSALRCKMPSQDVSDQQLPGPAEASGAQ